MPRAASPRAQGILEAATHVFGRDGFHGARVRAIAQAAQVAEGTVYLYYRSKEELLVEVFRSGLGAFLQSLERCLEGAENGAQALARLVEHHLTYLMERPSLARVTQIQLRQADARMRVALGEVLRPYFRLIDSVLERGQADGSLRFDMDRRVARNVLFGAMDQCVTAWVMSRHPYDLRPVAQQVVELVMGGLGPKPKVGISGGEE